jgi:beta-glucanase (GH16 family)
LINCNYHEVVRFNSRGASDRTSQEWFQHGHQHQPRSSLSASSASFIPGYVPAFFDAFLGLPGTLPSSFNWIFDVGTQYPGGPARWGNNEYETYTTSPSNIQITQNQTLTITPRLSNGTWTSARIETQCDEFVALPGGKLYVESRIKLGDAPASQQQGIWPAFWSLGCEFRGNYSNWPAASEWDFLESVNGLPTMYSTLHCGLTPGGPCNEDDGLGSGGVGFSKGVFHTVGFMVDRSMCGKNSKATWLNETLNWYLDGEKIFTVSGATVGDEDTWDMVAHQEHFLLLNVAVGGNWPGAPNIATTDGSSVAMEVDYVGVWNSL